MSAPGRGRPRRYCRASHRQRAYEARREKGRTRPLPDQVILSGSGWDTLRVALTQLRQVSEAVALDLAAGGAPSVRYAEAVGELSGAVALLQEATEPRGES